MGSVVSVGARWYQTGTVTVAVGNTKVTGANTKWATAGLKPGDIFTTDRSVFYEIASIESDTSLTLAQAYAGPAQSAIAYFIIRNFAVTTTAEMASNVTHLVNKYENVIDSIPSIVNSLDSSRNDAALSAGMGKALKAEIARKLELPTTSIEVIVDGKNGDDATATGSEAKPYRTIQAAYNALPDVSSRTCTIRIKAGTYVLPPISVKKWLGGMISFEAFSGTRDVIWETTSQYNALACTNVPIILNIKNIQFKASSVSGAMTGTGFSLVRSGPAIITDCAFDGFLQYGVTSVAACFAKVENCLFENIGLTAISVDSAFLRSINNTSTNGGKYGLISVSSIIFKVGTQPTGTIANERTVSGGKIFE